MVKHTVVWQFKPGTEKEIKAFLAGLEGLKDKIAVLLSVETHFNTNAKEGLTASLTCTFDKMDDIATYANDPNHVKVASMCKAIRTARIAVDSEI